MTEVNLDKLTRAARERGQPFRVLIVDDEQWIRDVFKDFCTVTKAFEVDLAESGAEAVQKVGAKKYDLVTLDLIMPEMSGLEALSEIKRASPQVPIMVITGNATEKLVRQAGVMGAGKVMYKPIRLEKFIAELTSTLVR
jgi:CheY-like chemotaxis protein